MPVDWTIDTATGVARIAFRREVTLEECLGMVRNVAAVTTVLGDCSLVLDGRELTLMPDYKLVLGVTELSHKLRNVLHPGHYALLVTPGTAIWGKCRQIASVLNTLGIQAELFENEETALEWCRRFNPRLASGDAASTSLP